MNQRDIEDVKMQAREKASVIMEEAKKEMTEPELKRALRQMWQLLPDQYKEQMALEQPELAEEMEKQYGGNPWYGKNVKSGGWPGKG